MTPSAPARKLPSLPTNGCHADRHGSHERPRTNAASELLETEGWAQGSVRALADAIGIKAPSLYKHLRGKEYIAALIAAQAFRALGTRLHQVIDGDGDALALLRSYRALALERPHHYRLFTGGEFPRESLPAGLEDWAGTPFYLATGRDPARAQALWAFAHGRAILEIDGRFAPSGSPRRGRVGGGGHAHS